MAGSSAEEPRSRHSRRARISASRTWPKSSARKRVSPCESSSRGTVRPGGPEVSRPGIPPEIGTHRRPGPGRSGYSWSRRGSSRRRRRRLRDRAERYAQLGQSPGPGTDGLRPGRRPTLLDAGDRSRRRRPRPRRRLVLVPRRRGRSPGSPSSPSISSTETSRRTCGSIRRRKAGSSSTPRGSTRRASSASGRGGGGSQASSPTHACSNPGLT